MTIPSVTTRLGYSIMISLLILLSLFEKTKIVYSFTPLYSAKNNQYQIYQYDHIISSSRIFYQHGLKMSNSGEYDKQSGVTKQINFLLTSAVNLLNTIMLKNKKSAKSNLETTTNTEIIGPSKKNYKPVALSFSSTHKHIINLKDSIRAHEYLSLPASNYSVLDSNLISRSSTDDDTFILSLPLGEISSTASSLAGSAGGTGIKINANVRTEVTVRPDPDNGRVIMESGPIYFIPTALKNKPSATAITTTAGTTESVSQFVPPSILNSHIAAENIDSNGNSISRDVSDTTSSSNSNNKSHGNNTIENNSNDGQSEDEIEREREEIPLGFADSLPEWLLWGGRSEIPKNAMTKNAIDNTIILGMDGNIENQKNRKNQEIVVEDKEIVKSSVQARFRVELQWKSKSKDEDENNEHNGIQNFMKSLFASKNSIGVHESRHVSGNSSSSNIVISSSDSSTDSIDSISSDIVSDGIDIISHSNNSNSNHGMNNNIDSGIPMDSQVGGKGHTVNTHQTHTQALNNQISEINNKEEKKAKEIETVNKEETEQREQDEEILKESVVDIEIDSLLVTAVVKVWVDINLPVTGEVAPALSFPPVKLLLNQAGALTTKAVLSTLSPALGSLLIKDYDMRNKKNKNKNNANDFDSINNDRLYENMKMKKVKKEADKYDYLTSDIEIK